MRNQLKRTPAQALKALAALMMVLCLILGTIPMAFAAEAAGTKPGDLEPSETKVYIKLSSSVPFFTGETEGQGAIVAPVAGSVCQLLTDDWYIGADGKEYYSVYYMNSVYNVLRSDVAADIMTPAELETYLTETLWKQTTFTTLRKSMNLVGDVRVHALQLALNKLGYYHGALDGAYGKQTHDAVAKFQRQKGLDADGSAGPLTQPVLYALASGAATEGGSGSGSSGTGSSTPATTGTLRTIVSVNLRKYGNTSSQRLAEIPKNVNLSFTDTYKNSSGVIWYQVRYAGETGWVMGSYVTVTSGGSSSSGSTGATIGTLRTNVSVNLRKYASKGSARLAEVPRSTSLSFTDTHTDSNGVTWYEVRYGGQTGWLMGTFVTVTSTSGSSGGSSGGSTGSTESAIGKVTITEPSTRVRVAPAGDKSGYVLSKGSKVDLLAMPVTEAGYTWYKIRTASGLVGYVRGDCATATIGSSSDDLVASTDKTFVKLPSATLLFTTETKPAEGGVTVPAGTVLMLYAAETYEVEGVKYLSLYYNNQKYNAVYADVSSGIMNDEAVAAHMQTLLDGTLEDALKREYDLVGDVRVYTLQAALQRLQLYTGKLDGAFGPGTQSAVRNFQRSVKITVDGSCGNETWAALRAKIDALDNPGSGSGGAGSVGTVAEFFAGATSVEKVNWDGDGKDLLGKHKYALVLDVQTKKVFRVYRWSGAYHADCVPASRADTKTMCEIVGFTYRDEAPSSAHLTNVIRYSKGQLTGSANNYAWPDFGGHAYGHDIGGAWDRRPVLVRPEGGTKIYAVSIYGWPHGYTGDDGFSNSVFPNGLKFHEHNNYYGMMCLHFMNSRTHGGNAVDPEHQEAINFAYNWARTNGYSSLCK